MKKEIAFIWADALESGDYLQCRNQLRNYEDNSFCCLGVLCNLHAQEFPEFAATQTNPEYYGGNKLNLPRAVMDWANVYDPEGDPYDTTVAGPYESLSIANDAGVRFPEIAKWIRSNYESL